MDCPLCKRNGLKIRMKLRGHIFHCKTCGHRFDAEQEKNTSTQL